MGWFMATSATAVWHALAVSVPFTAAALRIFDLGQSAGKWGLPHTVSGHAQDVLKVWEFWFKIRSKSDHGWLWANTLIPQLKKPRNVFPQGQEFTAKNWLRIHVSDIPPPCLGSAYTPMNASWTRDGPFMDACKCSGLPNQGPRTPTLLSILWLQRCFEHPADPTRPTHLLSRVRKAKFILMLSMVVISC